MQKTSIHINEIRPGGLELSYVLAGGWFDEALSGTEIEPLGEGVAAQVTLSRLGQDVLAKGKLRGAVSIPCVRCLEPARIDVTSDLYMTYGHREGEDLDPEVDADVDFTPFDGEVVHLAKLFREHILLALPMNPLCRSDCRGFCPQCGQDLNRQSCSCESERTDPRFAVLQKLKLS